jgi:phosphoribosyl-ATP pyrophosphohydrolase/phosphoribosyl-AMP cyclohydrolase
MNKLDEISFDESGVAPVVMQDAETGEVLTLAYANREAVEKTLESGEAHFYSRSRGSLWRKGETSGNTQKVAEVRLDCDSDSLLYKVHPEGPACHTGEHSCFYTTLAGEGVGVEGGTSGTETAGAMLDRLAATVSARRKSSPEDSYTAKLLASGTNRVAQKVGEESVEVVIAAMSDDRLAEESADLLYHLMVLLEERGVGFERVGEVLRDRHR